ncbi:MAG: hypothetical protein Q9166_000471 [cf. Caloplaca sp. 2 TL-2023]
MTCSGPSPRKKWAELQTERLPSPYHLPYFPVSHYVQRWDNRKRLLMNCFFDRLADGHCQVVINTLGRTVMTTWKDVWMSIGVVNANCVRAGKGGRAVVAASVPGTLIPTAELTVTVMDEPKQLALAGKAKGPQSGPVERQL